MTQCVALVVREFTSKVIKNVLFLFFKQEKHPPREPNERK